MIEGIGIEYIIKMKEMIVVIAVVLFSTVNLKATTPPPTPKPNGVPPSTFDGSCTLCVSNKNQYCNDYQACISVNQTCPRGLAFS
jgi:hypothetical protein